METNQETQASQKDKSKIGLYASLGVLIGFSLILLAVSLFQGKHLLAEIAIVLLGAMVTVVITYSLLKSQSAEQEKLQRASEELILDREKNVEVYKEKLSIYKKYFESLCDILEKRKISDEQQIQLQFQIASIALHTPYDKIEKITASLNKMLECIKIQNNKVQDDMDFMKALLGIVGIFKTELYSSDSGATNQDHIGNIIANLEKAFKGTDTDDAPIIINNTECSTMATGGLLEELKIAEKYRKEPCWSEGRWCCSKLFSDGLQWRNKERKGIVEIGFYQGHYYMQANYPNATEFAKTMKWKYGGRRSYGQWWKHLEEFNHIKEGEFLQNLKKDEALQQAVTEWCGKLMGHLEAYEQMDTHRQAVEKMCQPQEGVFYYFIWNFEVLCCQFEDVTCKEPFIDMKWVGDKVELSIGNRTEDVEQLAKVLAKDKTAFTDCRYELKIDASELKKTLPEYIQQIKSVIEKSKEKIK